MTRFPDCSYIWFLDQNSFIMNPQLTVEEHVMKASRLESLMIKDQPIVPPDSIIRTFTHLKGQDVDFVLTQDAEGLSAGSFLVRNGEWARFFLETWFDPIYRSYNFQKAEAHALVSGRYLPISFTNDFFCGPVANILQGTHRPMAPNYIVKACPRTAGHHQFLQQAWLWT